MAPTHKFCARCNRKHAAPTDKPKCRLPIPVDDFLDSNSFETLAFTSDEIGANGSYGNTNSNTSNTNTRRG
jgi:hypothetical protein